MQIFKETSRIDFIGRRRYALAFSLTLVIVAIASIAIRGLNLGIDFTGGTLIEVAYQQSIEPSEVRDVLTRAGYDDVQVQHFGTSHDVLIRLAPRKSLSSAEISTLVITPKIST